MKQKDINDNLRSYNHKMEVNYTMEENEQTKKPIQGTWGNMQTGERKPGIKFEKFGEEHIVSFGKDFKEPREIPFENGVFYVFDVWEDGEERELATSAWSLLRGLKEEEPLAGKTFKIVKEMVKGRQEYQVTLLASNKEEKVVSS